MRATVGMGSRCGPIVMPWRSHQVVGGHVRRYPAGACRCCTPSLTYRGSRGWGRCSLLVWSAAPFGCLVEYDVTYSHELAVLPVVGAVLVLLLAWPIAQCMLPKGERGLCIVLVRPEKCTLEVSRLLLLLLYPSLAQLTP